MRITSQAIKMLEKMIERHKKALEEMKAKGAPAGKIRHAEAGIRNYEEQLKRLKKQADEIGKE